MAMFAEALEYLITPAEPWARKLGYLKESIAIRARHRRCRSDWAEHLTRSNKFIEAIIKKIGGGDLLVVPEHAWMCQSRFLFSVQAGLFSRRGAFALMVPNRNRKVKRIVKDLTGVADYLITNSQRLPSPPAIDWFLDDPRIDLVVSANTAPQLGAMPLKYLSRHMEIDMAAGKMFEAVLMQRHFQWLNSFTCPSVILCDAVRTMFDPDGSVCSVESLLDQMELGFPAEKWDWLVAPVGEEVGGGGMKTEVHAYCDRLPA